MPQEAPVADAGLALPVAAAAPVQSDEQILGITADTGLETAPPPEAPVAEAPPAVEEAPPTEAAPAEAPAETLEEIQPGQPLPDWAKRILADPNMKDVGPKVQQLWDQHQAYREIYPTVAEARAVKDLFPGGAEEAKAVYSKATALDEADDQFVSGDPEAQGGLAQEWYEDNPEAFTRMVNVSARLLAEREPETYRQMTDGIFISALKAENFDKHVDVMREALASDDPARLKALVQSLVAWSDKRGISKSGEPRLDPERQAILQERGKLDSDREALANERYANFHTNTQTVVETQIKQAIQGALANPLKDAPFSEAGKKRIAEDVFRKVDETMRADKGLARQYASIVRPKGQTGPWNLTPQAKEQTVALLTGRAKALIATTAKQIIAEHTSYFVGANKALIEKKESAAKRVDVAGGATPAGPRVRKLTQNDVKGMTDEQILAME